jgi:predicted nucleotidyltransferase component of viral defense system
MDLERLQNALYDTFEYTENLEKMTQRALGYGVSVGKSREERIKLDLFYTDEFITPIIEQDGLRLASLQDIAAMKMQAIVNSKRKKDFWDIHELLEHYSLKELIEWGLQRNPYTLSQEEILTALCNADKLTQITEIHCFKGKFWDLIVEDLKEIAEQQ